jgi:hypothetical protein
MNQSTVLAVLAASATESCGIKWQQRLTPVLEQIAALIGSFFGSRALARQHVGL